MFHVLGRHSIDCFLSNAQFFVFESKPEKPKIFLFFLTLCVFCQKSFMGILDQFVLRALSQVTTAQVYLAGEPSGSGQGPTADCGYFFLSPRLLPAFVTFAPQH